METCKSPRKVMRTAYHLAKKLLPSYSSKFSRHDFTLPQLFACLVLREFSDVSYRRAEALLHDSENWCRDIALKKVPDHNTLWRAFEKVTRTRHINRMLDLFAELFARARLLGLSLKPLAMDSTCYEQRHRSRHYDRRCRGMGLSEGSKYAGPRKKPEKAGSHAPAVNRARSLRLRSMPKLSIAVAASCHLILSTRVRTGNGSDAPDFDELLYRAWKRAKVTAVVADSGYDSEKNHRIARQEMNVRSIIPPQIGRPSSKPPAGRWRRHMAARFARKADARPYGQRAQSETTHSMMKRNLGESLRSRRADRREREMLLRVITHNIMLLLFHHRGG